MSLTKQLRDSSHVALHPNLLDVYLVKEAKCSPSLETCWRRLLAAVVSYYDPTCLVFGYKFYIITTDLNRRNEYYTIRSKPRRYSERAL